MRQRAFAVIATLTTLLFRTGLVPRQVPRLSQPEHSQVCQAVVPKITAWAENGDIVCRIILATAIKIPNCDSGYGQDAEVLWRQGDSIEDGYDDDLHLSESMKACERKGYSGFVLWFKLLT
eukprot:jgi/Bigna1/70619/fgenesh1_pg.12_\